jgi:LmbE family N-acetylglucosaminyl deacetylase
MKIGEQSKILVISPHTDDVELAAGASVAKWLEEGSEVHWVTLSACHDSIPDGFPKDTLEREAIAAASVMGISSDRFRILDFTVREFQSERQRVLQTFYDLNREIAPDLVLIPALQDLHQDHSTVAQEALRAFKLTSVVSYDVVWNNIDFRSTMFVSVSETHIKSKIDALAKYESQKHRPYMDEEFLRAQLRFRGTQGGVKHAEVFEVLRWYL